jgi:hypothetical protein
MSGAESRYVDRNRPDAVAPATAPALPSLQTDNCIRTSRRKQSFVAQENIRLYIEKFGVNNVGVLTITMPSECLSARKFQETWHSFRTNVIVRMFPTGMWVRERQPRTGNWHSHAVVDLGRDIRTHFPFDQVSARFYANVDSELRETWGRLREKAARYGFGRTELLPIKQNALGCARYLTKYLTKSFVSEKIFGEEQCRLFGVWGGVRFVHSSFDWTSNRIFRKRKLWLARTAGCDDVAGFNGLYGPRWWFVIGEELLKVILPTEYYQVLRNGVYEWDNLGWFAYQKDLGRYPNIESDGARRIQSLIDFHYAEGIIWKMPPERARRYAVNRVLKSQQGSEDLNRQTLLKLEAEIKRTKKNSSP